MTAKDQENFLNDILIRAEDEGPYICFSPIPKQRLPHTIRMLLRLIYLPVLMLDLGMQSIARKIIRPPFKRMGACKRRGNCCRFILLPQAKNLLGKVYFFWQTEVNGFYVKELSPPDETGGVIQVLGCRHLSPDGRCMSYKTRPSICRRWPVIEIFGRPNILKGCGYTAHLKKSHEGKGYESLLSKPSIHK